MLVLIACRLVNPPPDHTVDMEALLDLAESLSFSEIRKRTLQSRFCTVLCDTTSDQDALLNWGGLVLPFRHMSLYVSFSPSMDDTPRTSLPKEVRIVIRSHNALFHQGGLALIVSSSMPLTQRHYFSWRC
jgi:hypothetical protein